MTKIVTTGFKKNSNNKQTMNTKTNKEKYNHVLRVLFCSFPMAIMHAGLYFESVMTFKFGKQYDIPVDKMEVFVTTS